MGYSDFFLSEENSKDVTDSNEMLEHITLAGQTPPSPITYQRMGSGQSMTETILLPLVIKYYLIYRGAITESTISHQQRSVYDIIHCIYCYKL